jgi:hypothetical protein
MPPEFAATKDSTSTPKMSSRRRAPAVAPLRAKTKVPTRSSVSTRVFMAAPMSRERTSNTVALIGRWTNTRALLSESSNARRRYSSIIGPMMKPSSIGAGSQRSFAQT